MKVEGDENKIKPSVCISLQNNLGISTPISFPKCILDFHVWDHP